MTMQQILSTRKLGMAAGALVFVGLAGIWVRPVKSQPSTRRILASAPIKLAPGRHVILSCLDGGPKPIGVLFHLMNATTGMPVASSAFMVMPPGQGRSLDVSWEVAEYFYGAVEVSGPSSDNVACSLEELDPAGTPVNFCPMAMNMQF